MVKTTVYLPEDVKRLLERLSDRSGTSEAELIRRAVEQLVRTDERPRPQIPLFRGTDPTLAERVDEALERFGE